MFQKTTKLLLFKLKVYAWKIISLFHKTVTIQTKQGVFTVFCADSVISRSLYYYGEFERDLYFKVFELLHGLKKIEPNKIGTVLDIGANIGVTSIGLINDKFVNKAIAIEPESKNFSLLKQNVEMNHLKNSIICLPYAITDKNKKVHLEISNTIYGDHRIRSKFLSNLGPELGNESKREVINVEAKSLDVLMSSLPKDFTKNIKLIWVDVQGSEGHVLLGGKNIFSKNIPTVMEIWPYGLKRLNISKEKFCRIAESYWRYHWVMRKEKFIRYPNSVLNVLFDELGDKGDFTNIIFTK